MVGGKEMMNFRCFSKTIYSTGGSICPIHRSNLPQKGAPPFCSSRTCRKKEICVVEGMDCSGHSDRTQTPLQDWKVYFLNHQASTEPSAIIRLQERGLTPLWGQPLLNNTPPSKIPIGVTEAFPETASEHSFSHHTALLLPLSRSPRVCSPCLFHVFLIFPGKIFLLMKTLAQCINIDQNFQGQLLLKFLHSHLLESASQRSECVTPPLALTASPPSATDTCSMSALERLRMNTGTETQKFRLTKILNTGDLPIHSRFCYARPPPQTLAVCSGLYVKWSSLFLPLWH